MARLGIVMVVVLPYTKYCLKPWSLSVLDYLCLLCVTYSLPLFFALWFVDVYLCLEREVPSRFPLKVSWEPLWQCIGKVCVVQLVPRAKLEPIIADKKDAIQQFRQRLGLKKPGNLRRFEIKQDIFSFSFFLGIRYNLRKWREKWVRVDKMETTICHYGWPSAAHSLSNPNKWCIPSPPIAATYGYVRTT